MERYKNVTRHNSIFKIEIQQFRQSLFSSAHHSHKFENWRAIKDRQNHRVLQLRSFTNVSYFTICHISVGGHPGQW